MDADQASISKLTSSSLKVTSGIITLAQKHLVLLTTFKRFVNWNRRTHEALKNLPKAVQARLKFQVVISGIFCDR